MLITIALATATGTGVADPSSPGFVNGTGSPLAVGQDPLGVSFGADGKLLASADYVGGDISVFTVDPATGVMTPAAGSPFTTAKGPDAIAFSPTGTLLAASNLPGNTVSVYTVDPATGSLTAVPGSPFPTGVDPRSVAFSPSGSLLAVANASDNTVSVFAVNLATGTVTPVHGSPFATGSDPVSVAFSTDGGLLATADIGDGTVSMFSVLGSGALTPAHGSPFSVGGTPYGLAFSPDGGLLGVADANLNELALFFVDSATGGLSEVPGSPLSTGSSPYAVAFSPDGTLVATADHGSNDAAVFALNSTTGAATPEPGSPYPAGNEPHGLSFGPVSDELAVADGSGPTVTLLSPAPPTVTIASPNPGQTFNLGASVPTTFACADSPAAPGLVSCVDSSGVTGGSGALDTSDAGPKAYSVTATSRDGQTTTVAIPYTVEALFPEPESRPTINQPAALGRILTCETGSWRYLPSSYAYQWLRNGIDLTGETNASYTVARLDEGSSLSCAVTASNEFGVSPTVRTGAVRVPIAPTKGCPSVTGSVSATGLGPILLGEQRAAVRARLRTSSRTTANGVDAFCLTPAPVRVGYGPAPRKGSFKLPAAAAPSAWIISSAPYYTYDGLGPGSKLRRVMSRLRHGLSTTSAGQDLYGVERAGAMIVFGARHGLVDEIGVLTPPAGATRAQLMSALAGLR